MTVVCSWCRHEGLAGVFGEKAPFEDRRETHGICPSHRIQVHAGWMEARFGLVNGTQELTAQEVGGVSSEPAGCQGPRARRLVGDLHQAER